MSFRLVFEQDAATGIDQCSLLSTANIHVERVDVHPKRVDAGGFYCILLYTGKKIAHSKWAKSLILKENSGGEDGNRTRLNGFAGRCITSLLPRQTEWYRCHVHRYGATSTKREARLPFGYSGAGEEARTLDLNLGKVALYQLSYSRFVVINNRPAFYR